MFGRHESAGRAARGCISAIIALGALASCTMLRKAPAPAAPVHNVAKTEPRASAANGASAGIAPGDVGYYLDALQGRLLQKAGARVAIARHGRDISVTIEDLQDTKQVIRTLRTLAGVLVEYRWMQVSLRCGTGSEKSRADAIRKGEQWARILVLHGVAAARIKSVQGLPEGSPEQLQLVLEPFVSGTGSHP